MTAWEVILRYLFMGLVIYFLILGKGSGNTIGNQNQTKMTIAILLLFALMDIYSGIWNKVKGFLCSRGAQISV
jgi:hypothetical protein